LAPASLLSLRSRLNSENPRRVPQRRDGDVRREARAVLAHPHALFLVSAMFHSEAQHLVRSAPRRVLRRKEARKVGTDDLGRAVAFDPFRTGIPTDDHTVRVDHEDRVVVNAIDQESIALFTLPQRFLHEPASRFHLGEVSFRISTPADVADGGCDQNAVCAFQGTQHDLDGKLAALLALP
jgi:hypothetical protein